MLEMSPKVWKGIRNLPRISNRFWQEFLIKYSKEMGNIVINIFSRGCRNWSLGDIAIMISYSNIPFIYNRVSMPRNALLTRGGLTNGKGAFKLDKEIITC